MYEALAPHTIGSLSDSAIPNSASVYCNAVVEGFCDCAALTDQMSSWCRVGGKLIVRLRVGALRQDNANSG